MEVPIPAERRLQEYWDWVAVALFLLLSIDLLTTVFAAQVAGVHAEANPIVVWAFGKGIHWLAIINLGALLVLAGLFHILIRLARNAPEPYGDMIALSFEIWVGMLIAIGLFIFANNLTVIIAHEDLVTVIVEFLT